MNVQVDGTTTAACPSLAAVLLRRRWRTDTSFLRLLVTRWGLTHPVVRGYVEGRLPRLSDRRSLAVLYVTAAVLDLVVGLSGGLALSLVVPELAWQTLLPGVLLAAALVGLTLGAGAWRRVGAFPFTELQRLAPAPDERLAACLVRVEALRALCRRSAVLAVLATLAVTTAAGAEDGRALPLAVATAALLLPLFALTFLAASRVMPRLVRRRARRRVGVAPLVRTLVLDGMGFLAGLVLFHVGVVTVLREVRAVFAGPESLLVDALWEDFARGVVASLRADAARWVGSSPQDWGAVLGQAGSGALTLTAVLVVVALLALRLPPVLVTGPEVPGRSGADALDRWVAAHRTLARDGHPLLLALVRRLDGYRWLLAHRFWARVLPPVEAWFYLGCATALLAADLGTGLAVLVLAVTAVMTAHNIATEMRVDLAPLLAAGADRAFVPLLLQAPGPGLHAAVEARVRAQAWQTAPPVAVATAVLVAMAAGAGLPGVVLVCLPVAMLVLHAAAVRVQWYMGPVLFAEAASERALEHGEGALSSTLQSTLQALPRYGLVVVPALVTAVAVVLPSVVPAAVLTGTAVGVVALHLLALPALAAVTERLTAAAAAHGLEIWRVR